MNIIFLAIVTIICNITNAYSLAYMPQAITSEEYEQLKKIRFEEKPINFAWFDSSFRLSFCYKNNNTSFTIYADKNIYEQLSNDIKQQFLEIEATEENNIFFIYTWGEKVGCLPKNFSTSNYYVSSPYKSSDEPLIVTVEEVAQLIEQKKVVFYTGAGISAAHIPAMQKLEEMVGLIRNDGWPAAIETITNILSRPDSIASNFTLFVHTTIAGKPTIAHNVLSSLVNYAKILVITENVDLLHEAAGIKPFFAGSQLLRTIYTAEYCQNIDVLICIGLSHDDRGLIQFYKKHHPQGKVLALDLKKPEYLDGNDMLLQGDIQQNLPLIHEWFFATKEG